MSTRSSEAPTTGRHRLDREPRQILRAAVLVAPVMTAGAVGLGLSTAQAAGTALTASAGPADRSAGNLVDAARGDRPDRSLDRTLTQAAAQAAKAPEVAQVEPDVAVLFPHPLVRYATDSLDIRQGPAADAGVDSEIASGTMIKATGIVQGDFSQVLWKGEVRWVTKQYLADERPATPEALGLSDKPCRDGGVERGLTSGAVRVYRAVCNNFPDITSYGGYDAHGEHSSGKAIDIMHPSVEEGYRIAEFLKSHASELGLYDVIWRQHIWTPVRAGEGWRAMPNRGSATANHFDHVHVSVK